jgi:hypothetical protein
MLRCIGSEQFFYAKRHALAGETRERNDRERMMASGMSGERRLEAAVAGLKRFDCLRSCV